jgi:hypothetical protein
MLFRVHKDTNMATARPLEGSVEMFCILQVRTVLETWSPKLREEGASEEDAVENVEPTRDGVRLL